MSKPDATTTVQELKTLVATFGEERNWGRHNTPKNVSMNIAIEAAELMEHFVWEGGAQPDMEAIADELADIIFNCLNFANATDIDITSAFMSKFKKVVQKYPTSIFNAQNDSLDEYRAIKKRYRSKQNTP
jgi:dCTP diphosphatase